MKDTDVMLDFPGLALAAAPTYEVVLPKIEAKKIVRGARPHSNYETERGKPMPNIIHGFLQTRLVVNLDKFSDRFDFMTEVTLDLQPAATPDVCIYPRKESYQRSTVKAKTTDMPLTSIEIVSPSQSIDEMAKKVRDVYFPAGIKSAWILVPAFKAIHLMLPGDRNSYFDKGDMLDPTTGIKISVDKIFERIV